MRPADGRQHAVGAGDGRGAAGFVIDQREFSENAARANGFQNMAAIHQDVDLAFPTI